MNDVVGLLDVCVLCRKPFTRGRPKCPDSGFCVLCGGYSP